MLAFLYLHSLTFPPFINQWFSHTLCFHISLVSIVSLVLYLCLCLGLPVVQGAISVVNEFVISFSTQTSSFLFLYSPIQQSRCTTHGENTEDAFPCATRDVHNPIPLKQMSYINLSPRKPRDERVRGERGGKDEEQRNDQGGFWKAAGSKSDPICYNATHTQTHTVGL